MVFDTKTNVTVDQNEESKCSYAYLCFVFIIAINYFLLKFL